MYIVQSLILFYTFISISWANVPRPRGVEFTRASLYQSSTDGSWVCLDGLKKIKFLQINDDFCDCEDGSDEPGTSACESGQFYCENKLHREEYISSSRVNDGICDCCDGTDEYAEGEMPLCQNICAELGRAAYQAMLLKSELHKIGSTRRAEMIVSGKKLLEERKVRLAELSTRRKEQEALKMEQEELKRQAEANEAAALDVWRTQQRQKEEADNIARETELNKVEAETAFNNYDTNKDGLIDVNELKVNLLFDKNHNGVVEIEEAKFFLNERESIDLNGFLTHAWPRFKSQEMLSNGVFEAPNEDKDSIIEPTETQNYEHEGDEEHNDHEEEQGEEEEEEETYDSEEADVGTGSVVETSTTQEYDPETQHLVELATNARNAYNEVERILREIDNEIKEIDEQNTKDYGPNNEYALLDGQCYSLEDREYVYTLCPFDRTSQKQRSGHSETLLGRWDSWGGATDKYSVMRYTQGTNCWNGPQRSALIEIHCGLEEKIISVSEPNRCEYLFKFETAAACDPEMVGLNEEHNVRDEL